jgi:hypothetical protein
MPSAPTVSNAMSNARRFAVETAEGLRLGDLIGPIQPGFVADLVGVAGNRAGDIAALGAAVDVIESGRPAKLDGRALV